MLAALSKNLSRVPSAARPSSSLFTAPTFTRLPTSTSTSTTTQPCISMFTRLMSSAAEYLASVKVKRFKAHTPGLRHLVQIDRSELWQGRPIASLTVGKKKKGGRSNGRICVRHQGGGSKQLYRFIDFKREKLDTQGVIQRLEYDPNRTAYIALVAYPDGELSYIIAPDGLRVGDTVMSSQTKELDIKIGNCMPLGSMPIGTVVHNVEMHPGRGGQLARSAGASATLIDKNTKPGYALVALTSKEQRYILLKCMATIGSVSNPLQKIKKLGKAGRSRWLGITPSVRGVAMNPIDHPMGGGNGKGKGRLSCSPTGVLAKGYKTRKTRNVNKLIVVPRGGVKKGASGFGGAAAKS